MEWHRSAATCGQSVSFFFFSIGILFKLDYRFEVEFDILGNSLEEKRCMNSQNMAKEILDWEEKT